MWGLWAKNVTPENAECSLGRQLRWHLWSLRTFLRFSLAYIWAWDQGDQMILWKSRPKCCPTHILSEVLFIKVSVKEKSKTIGPFTYECLVKMPKVNNRPRAKIRPICSPYFFHQRTTYIKMRTTSWCMHTIIAFMEWLNLEKWQKHYHCNAFKILTLKVHPAVRTFQNAATLHIWKG
jgi:hypothetical protein